MTLFSDVFTAVRGPLSVLKCSHLSSAPLPQRGLLVWLQLLSLWDCLCAVIYFKILLYVMCMMCVRVNFTLQALVS